MVKQSSDLLGDRMEIIITSTSPEQTRHLGEKLGKVCRGGEAILLYGDLGAGKTCFTQGLALGLGINPNTRITSPTFTLHGEYLGRLVLNHVDLYRLEDPDQVETLGMYDMIDTPNAVLAAEWPEYLAEGAAGACLSVRLEHVSENERKITLVAEGKMHCELIERLEKDGIS